MSTALTLPTPSTRGSVCFPRWRATLSAARLPAGQRWRYATEIERFLKYCSLLQAPENRTHARHYLARITPASNRPQARQALRWFFRLALVARPLRPHEPAADRPWWDREPENGAAHPSGAWYIPPDDDLNA